MKKLSIMLALSLAAFGCKKGGDCEKAITNSMEVSKADLSKMPGVDAKMMGKMKDLAIQHCTDDKWSGEVTKCMIDAKTETEAQACYGKMSADQTQKMNKAMELMTPPAAAAGSAAPDPAAAGSAGSAK